MGYLFKSERLGFRHLTMDDFDDLLEINTDEEAMRFFPSIYTAEATEKMIQKNLDFYNTIGYGRYAMDLLDSGTFIGFVGSGPITFEFPLELHPEIGWRINKKYWNKGYATEGAKASLDYDFENLGFDKVYSFTAIPNKPSERIMQKLGMKQLSNFLHPRVEKGHELSEHVLYEMTRAMWES